jgi:hypothetical protein
MKKLKQTKRRLGNCLVSVIGKLEPKKIHCIMQLRVQDALNQPAKLFKQTARLIARF